MSRYIDADIAKNLILNDMAKAERKGKNTYTLGSRNDTTADDEMPDCLNCDNCDSGYDCSKFCGAEHGWFGYRRTENKYKSEGEG